MSARLQGLPRQLASCLALGLCIGALGSVAAEPGAAPPALSASALDQTKKPLSKIKFDASGKPTFLARFSDGPRNVPASRGTAKLRADRLGIGGHEFAREMLWTRPSPELLGEVHGESSNKLLWPVVNGHWGRGFGFTRTLRPELAHNGVDIGAKAGTVVRAVADGLVIYSDNGLTGYGNCVMVLHQNGFMTLYAHTMRTTVQAGWRVKRGERIGLVGSTGYAWGPHLHFELRDNGKLRDPGPLFTGYKSEEVNGPLVDLEPDDIVPEGHDVKHEVVPEGHAVPAATPVKPEPIAAAVLHQAPPEPQPSAASASNTQSTPSARSVEPPAKNATPSLTAAPATRAPTAVSNASSSTTASATTSEQAQAAAGFAAVEHFLREAPTDNEQTLAGGRTFHNLLWPAKGGAACNSWNDKHGSCDIKADAGTAVRAAADGLVVYSGPLAGYSDVVVLLHGNGWVSVYGGVQDIAVREGDRLLRGQWLAHVAAAPAGRYSQLRFDWLDHGHRSDPRGLFVGAP